MPPHLKRVPFVPSSANEEPLPELALPARAELPAPDLPVLTLPEAPTPPEQPLEYVAGAPRHGADWSGERPLQEELPRYRGAEEEPIPSLVVPNCEAAPATLVRHRERPVRHTGGASLGLSVHVPACAHTAMHV